MAIQIYCDRKLEDGKPCKTSNALNAKKCSKCGAEFGRNKKFRVCVSVKGRRVNRIVDNLTIAREVEGTIKGDLVRGEYDIHSHKVRKAVTLDDVWAKYLPWAKEHKKSWKDDEWYYGRHIAPRFASKTLESISPIDIERMKAELRKTVNRYGKPYAAATVKHQIVILRRLFNVARKWGLYNGANPVDQVQMPKLDNQVTEFLSEEELRRLLNVLDEWPFVTTAGLIKLAIFTGMRRSELFKLTWDDVDFERGMITIRDPKGGKSETLPISEEALTVIRALPVSSDYVFPSPGGNMRTSIRNTWLAVKKKAGLPGSFRFHGLRHSYASWLVSHGVDLATVQRLMTHRSASTTQRYAHLLPGALKQAADVSGRILSLDRRPRAGETELQ